MTDDRITQDEIAYHKTVVARLKQAQALRKEADAAEAAFRSWAEYLHEKYNINAGGGVDEDGNIVRRAEPQLLDSEVADAEHRSP